MSKVSCPVCGRPNGQRTPGSNYYTCQAGCWAEWDENKRRTPEVQAKERRGLDRLARRVMNQRREIRGYLAEIAKLKNKLSKVEAAFFKSVGESTELQKQIHEAKGHPAALAWQNLMFDLYLDGLSREEAAAQIKAWKEEALRAVQWATYDGTPETLPDEGDGRISTIIILNRIGTTFSVAATYRVFVNCHFPGDCSTLSDDFLHRDHRSLNMVWELAEEPYSKYEPQPGDRWAHPPTPEVSGD